LGSVQFLEGSTPYSCPSDGKALPFLFLPSILQPAKKVNVNRIIIAKALFIIDIILKSSTNVRIILNLN
jgi:hypothetical protein